jgi:hypothetical protein
VEEAYLFENLDDVRALLNKARKSSILTQEERKIITKILHDLDTFTENLKVRLYED